MEDGATSEMVNTPPDELMIGVGLGMGGGQQI
jgi:hypothetical protein